MSSVTSTDEYFNTVAIHKDWYKQRLPFIKKVGLFYKNHAHFLEGIAITGIVLGLIAVIGIGVVHARLDLSGIKWITPTLGAVGGTILLVSVTTYLFLKALGLYFPPVSSEEIFLECEVNNPEMKLHGKLKKLDNGQFCLMIPCGLKRQPEAVGRTHGYLVASALQTHIEKIRRALWIMSLFDKDMKALRSQKGYQFLEQMFEKLPLDMQQELEGVIEGYRYWCQENNKSNKGLTVIELFLLHFMPDLCQIRLESELNKQEDILYQIAIKLSASPFVLGCTTLVAEDKKEGMSMARLLDWESLGVFHSMSILIATDECYGTFSTLELGFAGIIGSFTAMNNHGMALAMNRASIIIEDNNLDKKNALPACLFNKLVLRNFKVNEAISFIRSEEYHPLIAYHLTICDEYDAATVHILQTQDTCGGDSWNLLNQKHIVRHKKNNAPLYVANEAYFKGSPHLDSYGCGRSDWEHSFDRENRLQQAWDESVVHAKENGYEHSPAAVTQHVSKIGQVNNSTTIQSVHMNVKTKAFAFSVASNFAGSLTRVTCNFNELFDDPIFKISAAEREFLLHQYDHLFVK